MNERVTSYAELLQALAPERESLLAHPIYASVKDAATLRPFMECHVFAVWDFMSLLKSLQQRLTCVSIPWTPPRSRTAARLINEIVMGEESDAIDGRATSHFELYLEAMREVGADTANIERLIDAISKGANVPSALEASDAPPHVKSFVSSTFAFVADPHVEAVAAAFLVGREDLVPEMFRRLLPTISRMTEREPRSMKRYLERHIEVDGEEHGPLARKLLSDLCGDDEAAWARATRAARAALESRRALWDGVFVTCARASSTDR